MTSPRREFDLIQWIRERSPATPRVPLGIGDDAALVTALQAGCLVTTDLLLEGTHFDLASTTIELVGRKCLAVNLSDIAAMAGRPMAAFISIALPRERGAALAEGLYRGIWPLAGEFGVGVAGGDTNSWDGPLVVSVTLLGEPTGSGPVLRSGARPGDWLLVTGALGGSLAGRHLRFPPRIREAQTLHARVEVHAMLDLSDGLASDARHLARESHVGVLIEGGAVPISSDVDEALTPEQKLQHALGDGEDFELLFAVSPRDGERLLRDPLFETPVARIGEITADAGCRLRDLSGQVVPLPDAGWQHQWR